MKGVIGLTSEEKIELIEKICNDYKETPTRNKDTFLSVIGRQYDEDLISRVVAYILQNNSSLVFSLVNNYLSKKVTTRIIDYSAIDTIQVDCEVVMGRGRADIFVLLKEGKRDVVTITIENKIRSWEHNTGNEIAQTDEYSRFVNSYYKKSLNVFYYLKPSFNESVSANEDFLDITYYELMGIIGESNDVIINDFVTHIINYLGESDIMKFEKWQVETAKHYKTIKNIVKEYDNKIDGIKKDCIERIIKELYPDTIIHENWGKDAPSSSAKDLFVEIASSGKNNGVGSFRIYRNEWYKASEYYFYVEIYFEYGDICDIKYQITLRNDGNTKSVNNYINNVDKVLKDGKYIVFKRKDYPDENIDNNEWVNNFINHSLVVLRDYIELMDKAFVDFKQTYCE